MGSYLLAALAALACAGVIYLMLQASGAFACIVFLLLAGAGVATALFNQWRKLCQRLDRIEKALGIADAPAEDAPVSSDKPENGEDQT